MVRPNEELVISPFADGGEGTLDCIESVMPNSERIPITVQGVTRVEYQSAWVLVNGSTAIIELAPSRESAIAESQLLIANVG